MADEIDSIDDLGDLGDLEGLDELDHPIELDSLLLNKRISVRYRRGDISAMVRTRNFLFPKLFTVKLLDISSKGAAIYSTRKLKVKSRVTFFLEFEDKTRFTISARVAHVLSAPRYGLKFDRYQHQLAEHLLQTQTELEFG